MSFFKKLFKTVFIGAVVGLTGGLALGALGGLGITTLTGAALLKAATIYGAVYGGLQGAAMAFIKKPRMPINEVNARQNLSVDPQALGKWIFGETAAATDVVYSENIDNKQIVHIVTAAAHEIDSYGDFYINDELITFSGAGATGDWANALYRYTNLGTTTQAALAIPSSDWPSDATGKGIAHYGLLWDFDSDNGKEKLSSGIPTRITQVIKGVKVYDPRKDSTNGGTGSHRVNDSSTWEWSANWALIVVNYLLGYTLNGTLVYGVGVGSDEIDWPQVIAMADVCDTTVDGKPRYRIGGIVSITQDHEQVIGQLEAAIGGKVAKFGGKYYLWCPHDDLISAGTLTDADIISQSGIRFTPAGPIEELFNTARGRYVDADVIYQMRPYPQVVESTAVTEDGKTRMMERDFTFIQDESIAERVAREMVRRSRFTGSVAVVVGPRGLLVKPFDVITINFRETNFTNELFRVVSMQYSAQGAVVLELIEEDASIYDTSTALGTSLVQLDPDAYDPTAAYSVTGLSLSTVSVAGAGGTTIDGVKVSWNPPPPLVEFTEGGYRKTGDTDFIYDRVERTASSGVIAPLQPGTSYEFRVRHVSVEGVAGPYSTASITTGTTTSVGTAVIADGAITNPKIAALAVNAAKIADNAVETAKIANLAVEAGKIAANAVTTDKINALAVTAAKVADSAIETAKIAASAVDAGKLASNAVTTDKINALAVTAAKVAASAIETAKIANAAVEAGKIASNAVTSDKINALAVTAAKVAAGAIETAKIADAAVEAGKIAANAVTTEKINALAVTAAKIAASAIETSKIADLAVETGKLANAAATEAKIATNAITETKISDLAISTPKLAAGAVTAAKITAGTITAAEIAAATITGAKIAAGTIAAGNIAALTITAGEIASNAITTDKILASAITAAKIAAGTITANEIAASTITGAKIAAGTITASNIAALTITAGEIASNAITTEKILASAITAAKIAAGTITATEIAASTITGAKIAAGTITAGNIAALTITAGQIAANAITTDKILANAITAAKIAASTITANEIAASTITGAKIAAGTITASNIAALTITASEIAANAITADKILANTITAAKIAAGTITATEIAASTITGAKIAAGTITASNIAALTITASEIAAGAIVSGKIAADAVSVNSLISNTSKTFDSSNFAFEMGTNTEISGYQGAGIFSTQKNFSFAFGATATGSDSFAIAGQSTNNAGAGYGGAFVNSTAVGGETHRTEAYLGSSAQSGIFLHTSTANRAILGNATYAIDTDGDVYVDGDITATGSITPFTGSHDGVLDNAVEPDIGDILVDVAVIAKASVSDTLTSVELSGVAGVCAIGVYSGKRNPSYLPISISEPGAPVKIAGNTYIDGPRVLLAEYSDLLDDACIIGINSVGEGQINVCGQNGNIAAGDLIITSDMSGKGMRQDDDIIRAKTVARAREAVTFDDPDDVAMISCIYLCG
jgi:hypothetical protein